MNDIELRIAEGIRKQAEWEGYEIREGRLTRLAENVRSHLRLIEMSCDGRERWWATDYQVQDDDGNWKWSSDPRTCLCVTASDIGADREHGCGIVHEHPDCPEHGDPAPVPPVVAGESPRGVSTDQPSLGEPICDNLADLLHRAADVLFASDAHCPALIAELRTRADRFAAVESVIGYRRGTAGE